MDINENYLQEFNQEMLNKFGHPFFSSKVHIFCEQRLRKELLANYVLSIVSKHEYTIIDTFKEEVRKEIFKEYYESFLLIDSNEIELVYSYKLIAERNNLICNFFLNNSIEFIEKRTNFPYREKLDKFNKEVFVELDRIQMGKKIKELLYIVPNSTDWLEIEPIQLQYLKAKYKQLKPSLNAQIRLLKIFIKFTLSISKKNFSPKKYYYYFQPLYNLRLNDKAIKYVKNRIKLLEFQKNEKTFLEKYPKLVIMLRQGMSQQQISKNEKISIVTVNKLSKIISEIEKPKKFNKSRFHSSLNKCSLTEKQKKYLKKYSKIVDSLNKGISQREIKKNVKHGLNTINNVSKILEIENSNYKQSALKKECMDRERNRLKKNHIKYS